ncbi:MAG TPA: SDR family NAD(P)-dependent oxidoreductase [Gemmataceae bacterium]|nr:SDR family NAD(P)-dependent oxidoreductase [Gemmataceae bacterium]
MRFAGQVVLITGASSGIGRALAVEFARHGARVGVTARREDRLRQLADEVRAGGGTIEYAVADAADREAMRVALASLAERLGPCDVLIANAGVGSSNTATDLNVPGAEALIRTNLLGPMYAFEAVLPGMLARGSGHLVGVSSVASLKGLPTAAAYCASKAGLSAYLESLRISLRSKSIAVTTIQPGFVRTEMTDKNPHMMFVMDAEPAAKLIVRAIVKRKKVFSFPKRMRALLWLAKWAPDRLMERMVQDGVGGREVEVERGRSTS